MLVAARLIWFGHQLAPLAEFASGCILPDGINFESLLIPSGLAIQIPFVIYALAVMFMALLLAKAVQQTW